MTNMRNTTVVLLVLALFVPTGVGADTDTDDLKKEQDLVDRVIQKDLSGKHAAALAERFQVPVEKVEALRSSGKGWGAVTTELALAEKLAKSDPTTYPSTADALAKVGALRADGLGYGQIAKRLGFKLGEVVSSVRRERTTMGKSPGRAMDKPAKKEKRERPLKPPKPDRPERPDKSERPGRLESINHPAGPKK